MKYHITKFLLPLFVSLTLRADAQLSLNQLYGNWKERCTSDTANNSSLILTFRADSIFVLTTRDKRQFEMRFLMSDDFKSIYLLNRDDINEKPSMAHKLRLSGDTLVIENLWLPYNAKYDPDPKTCFGFIRTK